MRLPRDRLRSKSQIRAKISLDAELSSAYTGATNGDTVMEFEVGVIRNNHGDTVIGYKVTSPSRVGMHREHFSRLGGERARQDCVTYAKLLGAEASAPDNLSRGEASRALSTFIKELKARDEAKKAERAARPKWRA